MAKKYTVYHRNFYGVLLDKDTQTIEESEENPRQPFTIWTFLALVFVVSGLLYGMWPALMS
jgi:hypothetical protein